MIDRTVRGELRVKELLQVLSYRQCHDYMVARIAEHKERDPIERSFKFCGIAGEIFFD